LLNWVEKHKPAAAVQTHLLLAWMMWFSVGSALTIFGAIWLWQGAPVQAPIVAAAAVALGIFKSRFVLDAAAKRVIERIRSRGDGRCLGGFLSLRTWGLVVLMMVGGRILRGTVARGIVGPVYIAVGVALCLSSRLTRRAWREAVRAR
jgi:hypothetical protein